MTEAQSRYGIIETMNKRKVEAQKRLSDLDMSLTKTEMDYDKQIDELDKKIKEDNRDYESNHKSWKKEREIRLEFRRKEVLKELAKLEEEISTREANYETNHKNRISTWDSELKNLKKTWKQFSTIKSKEQDAIRTEVKEIETAISDLKEISKESSKSED